MARIKPSTVSNLVKEAAVVSDRESTAAYVAAMTAELSKMVRRHHMDELAYLLDMVRLEAESITSHK